MSANIYWEPSSRPCADVPVSAPSRFLETLRKLTRISEGHEFTLTTEHLPGLEALAEVQPFADERQNPYAMLVRAINKHESIRVWAVY